MARRGTIRNMGRVARELAQARRERKKARAEEGKRAGAPATATHDDYAEEAQAAERAAAWPQAAALWLRASETCSDVDRSLEYARNADACNRRQSVDEKLESIARNVLKLPTLKQRGSDRPDFSQLSVGQIKLALRAAYEAGRASTK